MTDLLALVADTAAPPPIVQPAAPVPPSGGGCGLPLLEVEPAKNAIFLELLGNGLTYSLNYERFFPAWNLGVRAGASFVTAPISTAQGSGNFVLASFPMVASYFIGSPRHKLELGAGATILYFSASSDSQGVKFEGPATGLGLAATAVIGYRFLPARRGFTFGAGFTPLLRPIKGFLPWGGLSAGYAF